MRNIAILIPSRDRNHKIKKLHSVWFNYLDPNITTDCIVILDEDNEHIYERMPGFIYEVVKTNGKRGVTYPVNQAANKYCNDYEYIGFWGDDHMPKTKNWNSLMYRVLHSNKPYAMAYANDLLQGSKLATEIIIDSLYIKNLGYMIHPDIQHLYCDDFWMYIGKYMNNIHYLDNVIIEHQHYSCGKSDEDSLYRELNTSERYRDDGIIYDRIINSEDFTSQLSQLIDDGLNRLGL